jgi:hypothetical protein
VATENFFPVSVFAAVTVTPGSGVLPERTVPLISNELGCVVAVTVGVCGGVCAGVSAAGVLGSGAGDTGVCAHATLATKNTETKTGSGNLNFNAGAPVNLAPVGLARALVNQE